MLKQMTVSDNLQEGVEILMTINQFELADEVRHHAEGPCSL